MQPNLCVSQSCLIHFVLQFPTDYTFHDPLRSRTCFVCAIPAPVSDPLITIGLYFLNLFAPSLSGMLTSDFGIYSLLYASIPTFYSVGVCVKCTIHTTCILFVGERQDIRICVIQALQFHSLNVACNLNVHYIICILCYSFLWICNLAYTLLCGSPSAARVLTSSKYYYQPNFKSSFQI